MNNDISVPTKYYFISILIAVLTVITAAGSLLIPGFYDGVVPAETQPGAFGQDVVCLAAGLLLAVVLLVARRRSLCATFVWLGILGFLFYCYVFYSFTGLYTVFVLFYIAIASLTTYSVIGILYNLYRRPLTTYFSENTPVKLISIFFFTVAIPLLFLWIAIVVQHIGLRETPPVNAVLILDLVLIIPAFVIAAISLWRRRELGYLLAGLMATGTAILGISIICGALWTLLAGYPCDWGQFGFFSYITVAGIAMSAVFLSGIRKRHTTVYDK